MRCDPLQLVAIRPAADYGTGGLHCRAPNPASNGRSVHAIAGAHSTGLCCEDSEEECPVITSIAVFLRYFETVNRRDIRDVAALPPEADGWRPVNGEGENAFTINQLVGHMAWARLYFAAAYLGEGWTEARVHALPGTTVRPTWETFDVSTRARWVFALEQSGDTFGARLRDTPNEWLRRKIPSIDSEVSFSGWRLLLMMVEHDVSHRSQIDTYAGMNDWNPPQIFNRSAEGIAQLATAGRAANPEEGNGA
jgi:uncharacterized damage-inducible protein DinB